MSRDVVWNGTPPELEKAAQSALDDGACVQGERWQDVSHWLLMVGHMKGKSHVSSVG